MREQRKIKRKRQRLVFILIVLLFCAVMIAYHVLRPLSTEALDEPLSVITVVVNKGDSLWKIADSYDNNKMDLRKYIDIIQDFNSLDTTVLQPGDRIKIPIYER